MIKRILAAACAVVLCASATGLDVFAGEALNGIIAMTASAEGGVEISAENFPDENFRSDVKGFDSNEDGWLSDNEINGIYYFWCGDRNISSLKGIEYLTRLTYLDCSNNQLTELDLSSNTILTSLNCSSNELTRLDLSNNTKITDLNCNYNKITSLNVSKCTLLEILACYGNQISELNISNCASLVLAVTKGSVRKNSYFNIADNEEMFTTFYEYDSEYDYTTLEIDSKTKLIPPMPETEVVKIDAEHFPDENFRDLITKKIDFDEDGWLSDREIKDTVMIDCDYKNISSLEGIEYFTELTDLACTYNGLTELDLSNNKKLTYLDCDDNELTKLDVSNCTALTELNCRYNKLPELNLSGCTELKTLYCNSNELSELNLSSNILLEELDCSYNNMTELDLSKNTALIYLNCNENRLTELNVSGCSALWELICDSNQLTELDVSKNTKLNYLICHNNQLTTLDVSSNNLLETLGCSSNDITELDLSENPELECLSCEYNLINSLNISQNTKLEQLTCNNNLLTELDVNNNPMLTDIDCENNQISELDISNNTNLTTLNCSINSLSSLDVSKNTSLTRLFCYGNQIPELDVSDCEALALCITNGVMEKWPYEAYDHYGYSLCSGTYVSYNCGYSELLEADIKTVLTPPVPETEIVEINSDNFPDQNFRNYISRVLDFDEDGWLSNVEINNADCINCAYEEISSLKGIEYFTELTELDCNDNDLTELDVSKNVKLTNLDCSSNKLTKLDVSDCTELTYLDCEDNQLTELNVNGCTELDHLNCCENQLSKLDVRKSTKLTDLYCYDNSLTELNLNECTELTYLNCSFNQLTELDLSSNPDLRGLNCNCNYFKQLNVSGNTELVYLDCSENQLSSLDLSKNIELEELYCYGNQIPELDLSNCEFLSKTILNGEIKAAIFYNGTDENHVKTKVFSFILEVEDYYYYSYSLTVDVNTKLIPSMPMKKIVEINAENFPDENFRNYVLEEIDIDEDGWLSDIEIHSTEYIDCPYKEISSLQGIEYFTELESLDCNDNDLTELDVSNNKKLTDLYCYDNQLTTLDVSNCTALTYLDCSYNNLIELDINNCTELTLLDCDGNDLTELDVSGCAVLERLCFHSNKLTEIDVSGCTELYYLDCHENQLSKLDVSKNTELIRLFCYGNQITSLDVSSCEYLATAIKEGTLSKEFYYESQYIRYYYSDENDYYEYTLSIDSSTKLTPSRPETEILEINSENFPDENFRKFVSGVIDLDEDGWLSDVEIDSTTSINCDYWNISSLKGIEYFTELTYLDCSNNDLTELDLSSNSKLKTVDCIYNSLTKIDISKNTALKELYCRGNKLTALDISNNPNLITAYTEGKLDDWHDYYVYSYDGDDNGYYYYYYLEIDPTTKVITDPNAVAQEVEVGTADVSGMQNNPNVDVTEMGVTFTDESGKTYSAQVQTDGKIMLPALPAGMYTVTASLENCPSRDYDVTVEDGEPVKIAVELKLYGDVNGDGKATTADLSKINENVQKTAPLSDYDSKVADVNGDGKVTTSDLSKINEHVQQSKLMW